MTETSIPMFTRQFECPSCGAKLERNNPATKMIGCPYCGQASFVEAQRLEPHGAQNLLIDYGSALAIGNRMPIGGHDWSILGRVRLRYQDGFWDEWYLQNDEGQVVWLQEDDGSFTLFVPKGELPEPLSLSSVPVGKSVQLPGLGEPIFITSKGTAHVENGEGELPFQVVPGDPADFVEGYRDGKVVSIEVLPRTSTVFIGQPVQLF